MKEWNGKKNGDRLHLRRREWMTESKGRYKVKRQKK